MFTTGLVLLAFSGHWEELGVPGPLDRGLMVVGVLMCGADLARSGQRFVVRPVHLVLLVSGLYVLASAAVAGTLSGTGLYALVDRWGVGLYLASIGAAVVYRDATNRRMLLVGLTMLGLYLGVTAVLEQVASELVWPSYLVDPEVGLHFGRSRGPYVEGVANGLMLICCGAAAAALSLGRWTRHRGLAGLVVLLCLAGAALTLTRAVWIAAIVAIVVCGVLVPRVRRVTVRFLPLGALAAALLVTLVPGFLQVADERAVDLYPVWDRINTNVAAVRMVESSPAFGIGWLRSSEDMVDYVRQTASAPVSTSSGTVEIHNVFLSRAAETGLVGFAVWLGTLVMVVGHALLRRPDRPGGQLMRGVLLVVVTSWFVAALLGPVPYAQPNYVLWVLAGAVLSEYMITDRCAPVTAPREASHA
ncbi:O-antigen ligase family protein [Pseudonocardia alni]|uniref:O-antigen ligase family protein n=1 Tax=Pseudonocardia alni TaxID=33907 RepID=UPI0027A29571|nr:O-antigen ligase family protein [Pseudonocardia alni]